MGRHQGWAISLGKGLFFLFIRTVYNERVKCLSQSLIYLILVLAAFGCNSDKDGQKSAKKAIKATVDWVQGDCIDTPLSPYIYQISAIEGDQIYLYKMGEMGKKVITKSLSELKGGKEPFEKIPCP